MSWSNDQKQIFARSCAAAGLADAQRLMILSAIEHAHCPKAQRVTSTSTRLTNADFEHAMASLESWCGGQIQLRQAASLGGGLRYARGHWAARSRDPLQRLRWKAERIVNTLEAEGHLEPERMGVRGWIVGEITHNEHRDSIEQLDVRELYALVEGLKSYGRRKGVRWSDDVLQQARRPACSSTV